MLADFGAEFGDPVPDAALAAERIAELLAGGETEAVIVSAPEPQGFALLRHRPGLYSRAPEAYLQELYVRPERRGEGLGRALMEAVVGLVVDLGCDRIDLGTEVGDAAARALYERMGFTNFAGDEGDADAQMLFYEREL